MSDSAPLFPRWRLGASFVAAFTVASVLHSLGQLLQVPAGFGVEDFLGWVGSDQTAAFRRGWDAQLLSWAPWVEGLYLGIDTSLFIPLYGLVFVGYWEQVLRDWAEHHGRPTDWAWPGVRLGAALVLALWGVDLVENGVGLFRMGLLWVYGVAVLGLVVALWLLGRLCDPAWLGRLLRASGLRDGTARQRLLQGLAVGVALVAAGLCARARTECGTEFWSRAGCLSHSMKLPLILLLAGLPLLPLLASQFGTGADPDRRRRVAALRVALFGILWRTRYVLAAIATCGGLLLGLDQGRDVIYAMASHALEASPKEALPSWLGGVLALAITAVTLWVLGFSCWLWARLALRVMRAGRGVPDGPTRTEDHLAKLWARLLGLAPALLVLAMVQAVLPQAVVLPQKAPIVVLLCFALVVVLGSIAFIWRRDRDARIEHAALALGPHYYASATRQTVLDWAERKRLFGFVPNLALPALALGLSLGCRALSDWGGLGLPTLVLPVVLSVVAFWLGVAGWISVYEESEAVPWFLVGLVVTGLLGLLGLTENHQAPLELAGASLAPQQALGYTLALGLVWGLTSLGLSWRLSKTRPALGWVLAFGVFGVGGSLWVVHRADAHLPQPGPAVGQPQAATSAADAVGQWLSQIDLKSQPTDHALPVYVVTAEGGGIRNAYWTALVLARLNEASQGDFERRSLAWIGVSGGSVGIAAYRACRLAEAQSQQPLRACIDRFGQADLLGPLVSAWFFEDAVARWIPVKGCEQPGCGMLSRGLWFEGAMTAAVPTLKTGLAASRQALTDATDKRHHPYLLLNSTWVESGERTVASELLIDWPTFPGARDELAILGRDLPLVSASHNSARFPYTNALGAVHPPQGRCSPNAYAQRASDAAAGSDACGHLADGGYFDNSGGHTAADLLGLVQRCLSDESPGISPFCSRLSCEERRTLKSRLELRHILVRNGVGLGPLPVSRCEIPKVGPSASTIAGEAQRQDPHALAQPQCAPDGKLFIDLLGIPWAAVNTTGIGANGNLAGARTGQFGNASQRLADLREDGPLYPLGWHLSAAARQAMKKQAEQLDTRDLLQAPPP